MEQEVERKQFTFYGSFARAVMRIRKKSERCDAYDAIVNYALFGIEPDLESMPDAAAIAFELSKPNLDSSRRRATSGKKGGKASPQNTVPDASTKPKQQKRIIRTERIAEEIKKYAEEIAEKDRKEEDSSENEEQHDPNPHDQTVNKPKPDIPKKKSKKEIDFDRFWAAYPKKVGKQAAKKSFMKAKVNVEPLIEAVERQKKSVQWNRDNGIYIPNPSTWLNQGRWEDELEDVGEIDIHGVKTSGRNESDNRFGELSGVIRLDEDPQVQ